MTISNAPFILEVATSSATRRFEGVDVRLEGGTTLSNVAIRNAQPRTTQGVNGRRYRIVNSLTRPLVITTSIPIVVSGAQNFTSFDISLTEIVGRIGSVDIDRPSGYFSDTVMVRSAEPVLRGGRSTAANVGSQYTNTVVVRFTLEPL